MVYVPRAFFSANEMGKSSTWRELKANLNVLHSYINLIKGTIVKHRTDNLNVVSILLSGSKNPELHMLPTEFFEFSIKNDIHLRPGWIPRSENLSADFISKDIDKDDFMLNPHIFAVADVRWRPHTVDRSS